MGPASGYAARSYKIPLGIWARWPARNVVSEAVEGETRRRQRDGHSS